MLVDLCVPVLVLLLSVQLCVLVCVFFFLLLIFGCVFVAKTVLWLTCCFLWTGVHVVAVYDMYNVTR